MQWKVLSDGEAGSGVNDYKNSATGLFMGLLGNMANAWAKNYMARNDKREFYKELGAEKAHQAAKLSGLYDNLAPDANGQLSQDALRDLNYRRAAIDPSAGIITNDNWQQMRNRDQYNTEYLKDYGTYLDGQKRINNAGVLAPSAYYDNRGQQYNAGLQEVGGLLPTQPQQTTPTAPNNGVGAFLPTVNKIYGI